MTRRGGSVFLLVLAQGLGWLSPTGAKGGELLGAVVVGFDSYSENYSVLQTTTVDRLAEFRTRLQLGYMQGSPIHDYWQIEAQSYIGEQSLEHAGRINLARRFGRSRLALENTLTSRSYHSGTTYSFANNFLRYDLRGIFQHTVSPGFTIGLTDRLEILDYDRRTEFDYDYIRNGLELSASVDRDFTKGYALSVNYVTKSIPDSSAISYAAVGAGLEYRHTLGVHRQIFIAIDGERRDYQDELVRSPFWTVYSNATLQPITYRRFGVSVDNVFETYQYDNSTQVFFSYIENRTALQIACFYATLGSIAVGPTYGLLRSGGSLEDEFTEVGGKLTVDYNSGRSLWLEASYEPGIRNYNDPAMIADPIYSDFVYHRLLLFGTFRVRDNTSLSVFANLEPEDHKVPDDDTTTTLFSADVTYSF